MEGDHTLHPSLLPVNLTLLFRLEKVVKRFNIFDAGRRGFQNMELNLEAVAHKAPFRKYIAHFAKLYAMF